MIDMYDHLTGKSGMTADLLAELSDAELAEQLEYYQAHRDDMTCLSGLKYARREIKRRIADGELA